MYDNTPAVPAAAPSPDDVDVATAIQEEQRQSNVQLLNLETISDKHSRVRCVAGLRQHVECAWLLPMPAVDLDQTASSCN